MHEFHPRHLINVDTLPCESQNTANVILHTNKVFFVIFTTKSRLSVWNSLWPPCVADADIIFLSRGFFYLLLLLSSLFSSRNLSRHGVALVRI